MAFPQLLRNLAGLAMAAALGMAALLTGCAGSGGTSAAGHHEEALSEGNQEMARGSVEAVEIRGHPVVTIRETIESVFTGAGFTVGRGVPEKLAFERPASRRVRAAYGDWDGDEVRIRLKVEITPQNAGVHLLRSWSFVVREPGSSSEAEQQLARRHVRDYERLLHEVAARLN